MGRMPFSARMRPKQGPWRGLALAFGLALALGSELAGSVALILKRSSRGLGFELATLILKGHREVCQRAHSLLLRHERRPTLCNAYELLHDALMSDSG